MGTEYFVFVLHSAFFNINFNFFFFVLNDLILSVLLILIILYSKMFVQIYQNVQLNHLYIPIA